MNKSVSDLEKEHIEEEQINESLERNPVKRTIQALFKGPLHGREYAKLSLNAFKTLVTEELEKALATPGSAIYLGGGNLLVRKIKSTKSVEKGLMALTDYLFS